MKLDNAAFSRVIEATPLVSIDLVIHNARGEVLLGRRRNRPALGYWFVPGGRIRKNESSRAAFARIAQTEVGGSINEGGLLGVFDHFYDDNFFGIKGLSTHYVAIAFRCELNVDVQLFPDEQHAQFKWWSVDDLLASDEVHDNTKLYFQSAGENGYRCKAV